MSLRAASSTGWLNSTVQDTRSAALKDACTLRPHPPFNMHTYPRVPAGTRGMENGFDLVRVSWCGPKLPGYPTRVHYPGTPS
eukprot:2796198-Rhodomonas_salina.1